MQTKKPNFQFLSISKMTKQETDHHVCTEQINSLFNVGSVHKSITLRNVLIFIRKNIFKTLRNMSHQFTVQMFEIQLSTKETVNRNCESKINNHVEFLSSLTLP